MALRHEQRVAASPRTGPAVKLGARVHKWADRASRTPSRGKEISVGCCYLMMASRVEC